MARAEDLMLYYNYSEGFKAGAGENAAPGAATNFVSIIVDPEEVKHHELGLKSTWLDNRLAVNIAGYMYDLEGQQVNKTLSGGPAGFSTIFENAAETSAEGVELEIFASPTEQFRLSAARALHAFALRRFPHQGSAGPQQYRDAGSADLPR